MNMADQKPRVLLQVALDFVELDRALKVAAEAAAGGADILEAGTPLIKSVGLDAVRRLRAAHPKLIVAADMKVMDAGRIEVESAAKAGAKVVHVLAAASDATIAECVEAGREYGAQIVADLLGTTDPVARAKQVAELGVDFVGVHTAIDMQMRAADPFTQLSEITGAVEAPVCVAGGIHSENAAQAVEAGAAVVIVGGAITKAPDARKATAELKRAITVGPGLKVAGPALTVRTAPGDYAKPVEAIDHAKPGEVIVVDAGGVGPAVWGEMATRSAMNRKVAGIVIDGALRDSGDIRALKFPAFSRVICPNAGEPRGLGEIGVSITVAGEVVEPGDWILGDDDGLVRVPRDRVAEWANRGMEVYERESRVREEILQGGTYGELAELEKWEKPR